MLSQSPPQEASLWQRLFAFLAPPATVGLAWLGDRVQHSLGWQRPPASSALDSPVRVLLPDNLSPSLVSGSALLPESWPTIRLPGQKTAGSDARRAPAPQKGKRRDKRRHLRRDGEPVPVLISTPATQAAPVKGTVINRSRGGLCVSSPEAFPMGSLLAVFSQRYPDVATWVEVEVKHCRARGDRWLLGCKFKDRPPWGVLLLFG
jgi:hypothetical protein